MMFKIKKLDEQFWLNETLLALARVEVEGYLCAVSRPPFSYPHSSNLNVDIVISPRFKWATAPLFKFYYTENQRLVMSFFNWMDTPIFHIHINVDDLQKEALFSQKNLGKKIKFEGLEVLSQQGQNSFFWLDEQMINFLDCEEDWRGELIRKKLKECEGQRQCHSVFVQSLTIENPSLIFKRSEKMGSQMNANFAVAGAGVTAAAQGALKNARDTKNQRFLNAAQGGGNLRQRRTQQQDQSQTKKKTWW